MVCAAGVNPNSQFNASTQDRYAAAAMERAPLWA
jgi:hypothetical protein